MANGQNSPNFMTGQVPNAAQWNAAFAAKQDANPPVPQTLSSYDIPALSASYAYTGASDADWTMPDLGTQVTPIRIQNFTSYTVTLSGFADGQTFRLLAEVDVWQVGPGETYEFTNYSGFWGVG